MDYGIAKALSGFVSSGDAKQQRNQDYALLQNLYAQMNVAVPWNYWQIRDSRTLFSLVPRDPNEKRTGLHNALEDCYFQAKKVQKVFHELDIKNDRY